MVSDVDFFDQAVPAFCFDARFARAPRQAVGLRLQSFGFTMFRKKDFRLRPHTEEVIKIEFRAPKPKIKS